MNIRSLDELFDFAIRNEKDSAAFYAHLARIAVSDSMRELLLSFVDEELGHKAKLETLRKSGHLPRPSDINLPMTVEDSAGLSHVGSEDMTMEELFALAIEREKAAYHLYSVMAVACEDPELRAGFAFLREQEARHRISFEQEYEQLFGSKAPKGK